MATKTKTKTKSKRAASKTAAPPKKRLTKAEKEAQVKREIARRNRIFQAATKAEKRVLIAKDVIAQIRAKRLRAKSRAWIIPENLDTPAALPFDAFYDKDASVQKLFLSKEMAPCNCCALGGLFMSCTLYNNKTTVQELDQAADDLGRMIEADGPSNGLTKFFSRDQLQLIEYAFEGGDGYFNDWGLSGGAVENAYANYNHIDDEKRLIAIMENIIENKGTFKP